MNYELKLPYNLCFKLIGILCHLIITMCISSLDAQFLYRQDVCTHLEVPLALVTIAVSLEIVNACYRLYHLRHPVASSSIDTIALLACSITIQILTA